jgi:thiol-disulfide isomerase/thioredoxin
LLTGVFVGVVVVGLAVAWLLGDDAAIAEVGGKAPDFSVELLSGGSFSLADHLAEDGRPLVVNLWASWCLPCRDEIPDISDFAARHAEVAVIGVAVEDVREDSESFAAEFSPAYPLAFGSNEFREAYPTVGLPATFVIDPDGNVSSIVNGIVDQESLRGLTD